MSDEKQANAVLIELCEKFRERMVALHLKPRGTRSDNEAIAFFAGAASALQIAGATDDANRVGVFVAYGLAFRGCSEVLRALERAGRA